MSNFDSGCCIVFQLGLETLLVMMILALLWRWSGGGVVEMVAVVVVKEGETKIMMNIIVVVVLKRRDDGGASGERIIGVVEILSDLSSHFPFVINLFLICLSIVLFVWVFKKNRFCDYDFAFPQGHFGYLLKIEK